jgi:hypothetical protein
MRRLDRILPNLFWLPIFLGGIVSVALVEPRFTMLGIISAGALGLFVILIIVQLAFERRPLSQSRKRTKAESVALSENAATTLNKRR